MLLPDEIKVCEDAGELFNSFVKLQRMHPSEVNEIAFHIHAIQSIVMARAAQRFFPDVFNSSGKSSE